ncbi:SurA N-terminal domain-containing protein [Mangrovivirga sp. M17]|uniref:Periplasmic chaperone PpiD n=1 Tax=Mangrovivirga halotolerans TaxID=2993936 RepID=A0ABT3RSJ5_9BACT|nr:peptidylprolyl isomerase [Mangrovivirga halotolerans]MCX2744601.1 SurA N-terminal domain-containing protein [Mangrovivirga halotolerans]
MAGIINTLRQRMATLLLVVIGLALLAFILTDLFNQQTGIFGSGNERVVGTVNGKDISVDEFTARVDQLEQMQYGGMGLNEAQRYSLRNTAWQSMINTVLFNEQFEDLGITVTDEELKDAVQGQNISPEIRQYFTNPQTGQFDKAFVQQYLNSLKEQDINSAQYQQWLMIEKSIRDARQRVKYDNFFIGSAFVSTPAAKNYYKNNNSVVEADYLYVPYLAIPDSEIEEPTDDELQAYINENEEMFQVERARSLKYVSFDVVPSSKDSAVVRETMDQALEDLRSSSTPDSLIAAAVSEARIPYASLRYHELPQELQDTIPGLRAGGIIGPIQKGNSMVIYKFSDVAEDTAYSVKASHILFEKKTGADSVQNDELKEKAEEVLAKALEGENFASLVAAHSDDQQTKNQGGQLGWIKEGQIRLEEFSNELFNFSGTGIVPKVVESEIGFHIIKVDESKTKTLYKIANVTKELVPSKQTYNNIYREAARFQAEVNNAKSFEDKASEEGISVFNDNDVLAQSRTIKGITNSRGLVTWLYNEAETGKVSDVFDFETKFVVAVMTGEREAGIAEVSDVRPVVTTKVKNQKKAAKIKSMLEGKTGSLEELANLFGEDGEVYSTADLKLTSSSIGTTVGASPKAVGVAFGLKTGERSQPIEEERGVIVVEVTNKSEAPEIADYTAIKNELLQRKQSQIAGDLNVVLEETADIEDLRYKFF